MSAKNRIHLSINNALEGALKIEESLKEIRWVIFSDHHRGSRDGADDFLKCEQTYVDSLNYYINNNSTLVLLGDVEEFWENPLNVVLRKYKNILSLEKRFFDKKKLIRVWGNHDDQWQLAGFIRKHLGVIFPQLNVHEAINLTIHENDKKLGEILLIHGHQGTLESDRFAIVSRFFVRYIWRTIQRIFKIALSTPSKNFSLKSAHDRIMYSWAEYKKNTLLICGHTHQPVFMSCTHIDSIKNKLKEAQIQEANSEEIEFLKQKIKVLESNEVTSLEINNSRKKPFYFNTGCCSFDNGNITGIEIMDGEIRLIHWSQNGGRKILEKANLRDILKEVRVR